LGFSDELQKIANFTPLTPKAPTGIADVTKPTSSLSIEAAQAGGEAVRSSVEQLRSLSPTH
jgi:hypothetical protein